MEYDEYDIGKEINGKKILLFAGKNEKFFVCTVALDDGIGVHWLNCQEEGFSGTQSRVLLEFNRRYDEVKEAFPRQKPPVEALAVELYHGLRSSKGDPSLAFRNTDAKLAEIHRAASSQTRVVYGCSALLATVILAGALLGLTLMDELWLQLNELEPNFLSPRIPLYALAGISLREVSCNNAAEHNASGDATGVSTICSGWMDGGFGYLPGGSGASVLWKSNPTGVINNACNGLSASCLYPSVALGSPDDATFRLPPARPSTRSSRL